MRALAVVLVVLDHAWRVPHGGFVGVDVFFVISGYLITGLLLRDVSQTGWVPVGRFYARRVRRIVPAATLVALVTVALGYVIWYAPRAHQNALDGLASLLWVSNWHFAATGTDYLAGSASPPALQHYWSLSVEEQFYLVWPWVLLAATVVARRSSRWLGGLLAAVALASFVWCLLATSLVPRLAYFDTIGRAWEFAVGALLVLVASPRSRTVQQVAVVAGLALVIGGAFAISPDTPFPGPWAVVPVAGTALVIWARSSGSWVDRALDNPAAGWLGDRSYSLYLWHFPALVLGRALVGDGLLATLGLLTVSLGLSEVTYRWVEQPVRHSRWLRSWEGQGSPVRRRPNVLAGAAITSVVVVLAAAQFNSGRLGVLERTTFPTERATSVGTLPVDDLAGPVREGLERSDVDGLTPSPDALGTAQLSDAFSTDGCENTVATTELRACTWGEGTRQVMVIGDSVAMAWWPTITAALDPGEDSVTLIPISSCSPFDVRHGADWGDPAFADDCAAARGRVERQVRDVKPALVIVSSAVGGYRLTPEPAEDAWERGTRTAVERLRGWSDDVVVLSHPPLGADPRDCLTRFATSADCTSSIPGWETDQIAAESRGVIAGGGRHVDTTAWFCAGGRCPLSVGTYIARADTTHITAAMAEALAPRLTQALSQRRSTSSR